MHHARQRVRFGGSAAGDGYVRAYRRLKDIADEPIANGSEVSSSVRHRNARRLPMDGARPAVFLK